MATAESRNFSPEQQSAYRQIAGFFGRGEREFPAAAGQLVNVVGGLVGEEQTTERKLQEGMGNIDVGLALIGDWLKETGADGFEVKLGFGGGAKKAIGRSQVNFPTASDLIRIRGRVNPELQEQIPQLLSSFSRQIRGGLDVGLSPRQIVGGLVAESVGSRLSANGSDILRKALEKPLAGHFEWIREALKIPDVAEQARGKAEVDLTLYEKTFVGLLEYLIRLEDVQEELNENILQQLFITMKLSFPKLPVSSRLRAEVMIGVNNQLGAEAEKLKKAGKTDDQIFEEWLKRVFIPLYKRAESHKGQK